MIISLKQCSLPDCSLKLRAKGLCIKHYMYAYYKTNGRTKAWKKLSPTEASYVAMLQRVKNIPSYRDKSIEPRWLVSFESFVEDMGLKPSARHTLDRIDNTKGYTKGNVRWADRTVQAVNRRMFKNNKSGHTGIFNVVGKNGHITYKAILRINKKSVLHKTYKTLAEALEARQLAVDKYHTPLVATKEES